MGPRAADKLKEIEEVRASLGRTLHEIEERVPMAGYGKKAAAALAGSSIAGSALTFLVRRRFRSKKKEKRRKANQAPSYAPPVVTVNVLPKGAAWIAGIGLAAWAGIKVYEALQRNGTGQAQGRPAVVTPMPQSGAGTGAGTV